MNDEIDLRNILRVMWMNRLLIMGTFLIAVLVAGAISFSMRPVYSSSSIILLGNSENLLYNNQASAEVIFSDGFLLEVFEKMSSNTSFDSFSAFKKSILIQPIKGTDNLLLISAETPKMQESKIIVDEIVRLYINRSEKRIFEQKDTLIEQLATNQRMQDLINKDMNQTDELIKSLENNSKLSPIEKELTISRKTEHMISIELMRINLLNDYSKLEDKLNLLKPVEVLQSAREPIGPVEIPRTRYIAIAGMIGLMIGIIATFLREMLNRPVDE